MTRDDHSIAMFMSEARAVLDRGGDLAAAQAEIGDGLARLSRRDDLTRHGMPIGPTDASTGGYLLWREPPHFSLVLIALEEHYRSPVHDHRDHWVVACGYRGLDRWDRYERHDDGVGAGRCDVRLVDQVLLEPGTVAVLPPPPRAIHSHNNLYPGTTLELIFSAVQPVSAAERMLYDVPAGTCRPSWFEVSDRLAGTSFPSAAPSSTARR